MSESEKSQFRKLSYEEVTKFLDDNAETIKNLITEIALEIYEEHPNPKDVTEAMQSLTDMTTKLGNRIQALYPDLSFSTIGLISTRTVGLLCNVMNDKLEETEDGTATN